MSTVAQSRAYIRQELEEIYGISLVIKPIGTEVKQSSTPNTQQVHRPIKNILSKPSVATEKVVSANVDKTLFDNWDNLCAEVQLCTQCKLHQGRQSVVFGEGDRSAELMFIGEAPGADEDKSGSPFVGKAGQLLTKMIQAMGYTREGVYIANVVKCRPPANREPATDEVAVCIKYLLSQINLVKPKVIVCLGGTAVSHLLNSETRISDIRGVFQKYTLTDSSVISVMPTYHPAYLLRNELKKKEVWEDLQQVMKFLGKEIKSKK